MFQTGEYIIYGSHGVCRVEKIGPMNMSGVSKDRLYYTLDPVYAKDSLLGEMSVVLGMDRDEVKEYILNHTMVEMVTK